MKAVVVGGGVVGLTTAYYLNRAGVDVEVVDSADQVGAGASTHNAGLIAPSHSFAWAAPSAPGMLVKSLIGKESTISLELPPEPRLIPWGVRFLRECTPARSRRNSVAKLRLARFSQLALEELIAAEGIECAYERSGVMYLYRSQDELDAGTARMDLMREHGQELIVLSADQIRDRDPAMAPDHPFVGAIIGTTDTTADATAYCRALQEICARNGVAFRLGTTTRIDVRDDAARGVVCDGEAVPSDVVVVAAGAGSTALVREIGLRLPVYPAKGYTLTVPIVDSARVPDVGGIDERTLVAWSRRGDFLRMSTGAEFTGFDPSMNPYALEHMRRIGSELFGDALDWSNATSGVGFRPMTPDGPPIIGPSKLTGLFYNTGHGHMGWTMACGSAQILTAQLTGRLSPIDSRPYVVRTRAS